MLYTVVNLLNKLCIDNDSDKLYAAGIFYVFIFIAKSIFFLVALNIVMRSIFATKEKQEPDETNIELNLLEIIWKRIESKLDKDMTKKLKFLFSVLNVKFS